MAIPTFVDRVTLHVYGGNGGHGCASVHRRSSSRWAGPTRQRRTTRIGDLEGRHRPDHPGRLPPPSTGRADNGVAGKGDHANGANGEDIVLGRSDGTVVSDADTGRPSRI